jgi:hypothetical protein
MTLDAAMAAEGVAGGKKQMLQGCRCLGFGEANMLFILVVLYISRRRVQAETTKALASGVSSASIPASRL